MSGWNVGDLAKCVDVGPIRLPLRTMIHRGGDYLELGRVYRVRALSSVYVTEISLEVGAPFGPKLARRFVKVEDGDDAAERFASRDLEAV